MVPFAAAMNSSPTPQRSSVLAIVALLINAFIWGLSWIPFRYLAERGVHSLWATSIMYAIVVLGVLGFMGYERRKTNATLGTQHAIKQYRPLIALLLAAGITNAAFNWAVTIGDVIRTVLLFYLMPVWTLLLARWILKERLSAAAWIRIGLCLIGAVLVLAPTGRTVETSLLFPLPSSLADLLALGGGMAFAATNVALRACANAKASSTDVTLFMFLGGALLPGLLAFILMAQGSVQALPIVSIDWVLGVAALAIAFLFGNLALQYGASRLPASIIAAVMPSEVVFASVSAAWIANEAISERLIIGGGLILLAALLSVFDKSTNQA
jgi:drug/metabolite transporter (DMT)-like permease